MSEPQSNEAPHIDVTAKGIRINGTLRDPWSVSALTELFGEPRVSPYAPPPPPDTSQSYAFIWDDLGIVGTSSEDDVVSGMSVLLFDDSAPRPEFSERGRSLRPTGTFTGSLTVRGLPPLEALSETELAKAFALMTATAGHWKCSLKRNDVDLAVVAQMENYERFKKSQTGELADIVRAAARPFSYAWISYKAPPKKSSGKWKLPAATEPVLEIASFPFRLAIIEELMYTQDLLQPKFDVYDFAQDQGARSFDPDQYYDEMIPSVRTWFRKLPLPIRLAESIETLVLDGGNEVFHQLIPQWDGEDDTFLIKSLKPEDLAPFTNLRTIEDIGEFLGPRARKTLTNRGITVN